MGSGEPRLGMERGMKERKEWEWDRQGRESKRKLKIEMNDREKREVAYQIRNT